MLTLLRFMLYAQVLLGLGRFGGLIRNQRLWETHMTLAILITLVALLALRSRPGARAGGLQTAARLAPLLPLATGLAIYTGTAGSPGWTWLHMLLGLATVGLVEAAAARLRRAPPPAG